MQTYAKQGEAAHCSLCLDGWGKCAPAHQAAEAVGIEEACDLALQQIDHYHGPFCYTWWSVKGFAAADAKRVHIGCDGMVRTENFGYGAENCLTVTHKCDKCDARFYQAIPNYSNPNDPSRVRWERAAS